MSPTAESKLATGQWKVYKQQLQALHALMGTQKVTLEARRRQREGKATSQKKLAKEYCYREWEREAGAQEARRFDGSPHLLELLPLVDAQGCLCEDSSSCSSGGGGGDAQLAQRFLELLARVSATGPLRDQAMLVLVLRRTATLRRRRRDGGGNGGEPAGSAALERFTRWGGLEVLKAMLGDCLARRERPGAEGKEAGELLELVLKTLLALPPDPEAARDANLPRFVKAMFGGQQQQQARSSGGKGSKSLQALAEQVVERFMRPLAVNRRESPTPSAPSASSSSSAAAAAASAGAAAASASAPKAEKPAAAAAIERQPSDAEAEVVGAKRPRPTPAAGSAAATAAAADAVEAERAKRIQLQQRGKGGGIKVVRPEVQVKKTPLGASPMDVDQPPSSSPRAEEGVSSAVAFPSAQAPGESHGAAAGGGGGGGVGWESAGLPVLTSFTEARKSKARKRVRWVDHEAGKPLQEVFLFEKYLGTLTAEEVAAAAEGGGGAGAGGEEGQAHHATVKELAKREHLNEADALAKRKFASGAVSLPWRRPRALPPLLFGPERDQPAPVPASAEAALQSARMRGRVEAMYLCKADIPRTPSEDLATVKAPAAGHGPAAAPEAIPWELDAVEAPPDVSDSPPPTTAASRLPPPPPPPPPPQPTAQPTAGAGATAAAPAPLGGLLGALLAQPALMQAATAQLQQQQQQQQRYNPPLPPGPPPPGSQYYPPPLPAPAPAAPAAPQADALLQLQALLAGIPGTRAAGGGGGGGGLLGPTSGGGGYGGGRGGYPQQQQQRQQQAYNPPGDQYYGGGGGGRGRGGRGGQGRDDGGGYGRGGQYNNRR